MLLDRPLRPMVQSGNSSNIHYYHERGTGDREPGRVWCEVLCNAIQRVDKQIVRKRIPDYSIRVYRQGEGEIAYFRYEPKTAPRPTTLSARTVTQLIRKALA